MTYEHSTCRECGADIFWALGRPTKQKPNGPNIALDYEPSYRGTHVIYGTERGEPLVDRVFSSNEKRPRHTSHFNSCAVMFQKNRMRRARTAPYIHKKENIGTPTTIGLRRVNIKRFG